MQRSSTSLQTPAFEIMKLTGISSMGISSQRYFTLIGALHKLLYLQLIAPFLDTVGLLHFVMRLEDEVQLCDKTSAANRASRVNPVTVAWRTSEVGLSPDDMTLRDQSHHNLKS